MLPRKIVVIGAGSASFGTNTLKFLLSNERLRGSELALVDTNLDSLEAVRRFSEKMNRDWGAKQKITTHSNHLSALDGAEFVIVAIEVPPREKLWRQDFEIPLKYGVRQPYAENGGPGGFIHAARNIGPILTIARDMEQECPQALMINFSNPMIRICDVVNRYSSIKVVGLCHQFQVAYAIVGQLLNNELDIDPSLHFVNTTATPAQTRIRRELARQAREKVNIVSAGINHFTWILSITDNRTGEDLCPRFSERWEAYYPEFEPLTRRVFKYFGCFPVAGDEHICEYLPWVSDPETRPWEKYDIDLYEWESREKQRSEIIEQHLLMSSGELSLDGLNDLESEGAIEIIEALAGGKVYYHQSANLPNEGYVTNLPANAIVEVPAVVNGLGMRGIGVGELPSGVAELCRRELVSAQLGVDAVVKGDRALAMQCLLLDPVIRDIDVAQMILDEYLDTYREYLPQFWM